jgi:hypothetical protein
MLSIAILLLLGGPCIYCFLFLSLRRGLRFASVLTDLLPLYPVLSPLAPVLIATGFISLLGPAYGVFLGILSALPSFFLLKRFIVWGQSYRLSRYQEFLQILKDCGMTVARFEQFDEFLEAGKCSVFIRHDVDISLTRTIRMAELEKRFSIPSTYFFRMHAEKYSFEEAIPVIRRLHDAGFEIGLHYDTLSHTKGDRNAALEKFEKDLEKLRTIAPVRHVCAHGHKRFKNQTLWDDINQEELGIRSVYELHKDIYISDAGGKSLIDEQDRHALDRVSEAEPDQVVQILIHPDWWF